MERRALPLIRPTAQFFIQAMEREEMRLIKKILTVVVISMAMNASAAAFTVSGTIYNLDGFNTIGLKMNGANDLVVGNPYSSHDNRFFSFPQEFNDGDSYAVTVSSQPTTPDQACVVEGNGSGTISGANVSNVIIVCGVGYPLQVDVSGLALGQTVIFQNNGGDDLSATVNGLFSFNTRREGEEAYLVSISSQPSEQLCSISGDAAGIMIRYAIVSVSCTGDVVPNSKDVTGDGFVNIQDVVSVINAVLDQ
jgi:hypothetical protein